MKHRVLISAASTGIAVLVFTACSGDGMGGSTGSGGLQNGSATQNAPREAGQFRLDEWSITADSKHLTSGSQAITALNTGHHTHELVIVKAPDAASLPTKTDGSVDEQALEATTIGEIADVAAGSSKQATFDLAPGNYVAFCNITDTMGMGHMEHNHFNLGMHTTFTVNTT